MAQEEIYKTVYQYSRYPLPAEDLAKLRQIAEDCREVKNYVYERYGGSQSLSKIHPGYTVQNEMTKSGLREKLGLPSVYFYLAVFEALGDIKGQWSHVRTRIEKNIRANGNLSPEDRHYLRFVLKQSRCLEAVLTGEEAGLSEGWREAYENVCAGVEVKRLNAYLRRQVRRHLRKPHSEASEGFTVSPKAYRYGDHGIYLATKEKRRRMFIPLTDNNRYEVQVTVRFSPEKGKIELHVPVKVRQRHPAGYEGEAGVAFGMRSLFVTDGGRVYGEKYLAYQSALTDYVRERLARRRRNAKNNPGMEKYRAGKRRREEALHSYVNAEINRMLETEKPKRLYFPKLPGPGNAGISPRGNALASMWQRGYIRKRLRQKCRERSIELIEVFGKGIGTECSRCGAEGAREGDVFRCPLCGLEMAERQNTAGNVLKRGRAGQEERIHQENSHG